MSYKQEIVGKLAENIKSHGYRVFMAESKNHGFYTDIDGSKLVSFDYDGFSGNYKTDNPKQTGQGWRISEMGNNNDPDDIFNSYPPQWATGESKWSYKTLDQYLSDYQKSSKFTEI